jgi:molecular chaperone DnaK (HSP70)
MKLGIDFGTTRVVVAAVDRGNYPVVSFDAREYGLQEWFPPLVAERDGQRLYGWDAWRVQGDQRWTVVRSIKRALEDAGPRTQVAIGGAIVPMSELLAGLTATLKRELQESSSVAPAPGEPLEVMLGVPANANSNQRFLTVEAFRVSGFAVLGLLNEPSAASIEFGHRVRGTAGGRGALLVYDFGGGTFDASLVEMDERTHTVIATEGIPALGGDDFDHLLAELALEQAGLEAGSGDSLSQGEWFRLHEECRARKEALHPNTRKIVVDLEVVRPGWRAVAVPVDAFYERCRPLVDETVHAVGDLVAAHPLPHLAIYLAGGASELPLVPRALREAFGRRVFRSPHGRATTAIGLAIQADEQAGYVLRERFTRHFGVWREGDWGRSVSFDPLFEKGRPLPGPGDPPLEVRRRYRPVHNIGHFRYLEASHRSADGQPTGEIAIWDEILFPFDPALRDVERLSDVPVARTQAVSDQWIEECYACDAGGIVVATIANRTAGYERRYTLGRWGPRETLISPGRGRKAARPTKR